MTQVKTVSNFQLTDDHIEQFFREGYFYAPGFLTPEMVQAINDEHSAFADQSGEKDGSWKSDAFIHFAQHAEKYPVTAQLLSDPHLVSIMEKILAAPALLWMGMYAVVPAKGQGLEWHQDNQYTHILGHMLNGFIALDNIATDNAGLWIAPRSHRLGRQADLNEGTTDHRRAAEPENGQPCDPMVPGDAVFFHRETLHHSKTNNSDKPRRAFAFQVASTTCRYAATGKLLTDRDPLIRS